MEVTRRSNLIRNLKRGVKCADIPTNPENQKLDGSESNREETESERPRLSRCNLEELAESTLATIRSHIPRVPKPPPRPSTSCSLCFYLNYTLPLLFCSVGDRWPSYLPFSLDFVVCLIDKTIRKFELLLFKCKNGVIFCLCR
ncbi:hypothetical protein ACFXTO_023715 [Malus domestica]